MINRADPSFPPVTTPPYPQTPQPAETTAPPSSVTQFKLNAVAVLTRLVTANGPRVESRALPSGLPWAAPTATVDRVHPTVQSAVLE